MNLPPNSNPIQNITPTTQPPPKGVTTWNQQSIVANVPGASDFQYKVRLHMSSRPIDPTTANSLKAALPNGLIAAVGEQIRVLSDDPGERVTLGMLADDFVQNRESSWAISVYSDCNPTKGNAVAYYVEISTEATYAERVLNDGTTLSAAITGWLNGTSQRQEARVALANLFNGDRVARAVLKV